MVPCELCSPGVFESVADVVFQNTFNLEIYQNNFFYFLKIIFEISASKWFKNTKKILIWSKEKKFNFFQNHFWNSRINAYMFF